MSKGIRKIGDIYHITFTDASGRQRMESSRSTRKREAKDLRAKRQLEKREGKLPQRMSNISFADFAQEYLKLKKHLKSYKTLKRYVQNFCNDFGHVPLRKFNAIEIEKYRSKRLAANKKESSVHEEIVTLKSILCLALRSKYISDETYREIQDIKNPKGDSLKLRYLEIDECDRLIELSAEHLRPIIITLLHTGLRPKELFNLRWHHVNLSDGYIHVEDSKTKQSTRQIPISKTLDKVLRKLPRHLGIDYVFFNPDTLKPYRCIQGSFKTACERAKLRDVTPYTLRHTFASHLAMAGVPLATIARLLGHTDIKMAMRYAHIGEQYERDAVNVLDERLNQNKKVSIKLIKNL